MMNFQESVEFLTKLVSIESQTKNKIGVNLVQTEIESVLLKMNFKTTRIPHPENLYGDLLVAERMSNFSQAQWVHLIGHADTVLASHLLKREKMRLIGAGVADNKGGVATLLYTLSQISHNDQIDHLRVVISPNEEIGSLGFHDIFRNFGKTSSLNLGFEPGLEEGEFIRSRNGNRWYEIKLTSTSGHAGRAPKGRINLNHRLAHFIVNLEKSLESYPNIKFQLTSLKNSTDRFNVIPDELIFKLDARFANFNDRDHFHLLLTNQMQIFSEPCEQTGISVQTELDIADDCPPMAGGDSLFDSLLPLPSTHSGGAADINYFSTPTSVNLDGCGGRGGMLHSKEEWFDLESMKERGDFLSAFLLKRTEIRYKPDSVLNYHSSRP